MNLLQTHLYIPYQNSRLNNIFMARKIGQLFLSGEGEWLPSPPLAPSHFNFRVKMVGLIIFYSIEKSAVIQFKHSCMTARTNIQSKSIFISIHSSWDQAWTVRNVLMRNYQNGATLHFSARYLKILINNKQAGKMEDQFETQISSITKF